MSGETSATAVGARRSDSVDSYLDAATWRRLSPSLGLCDPGHLQGVTVFDVDGPTGAALEGMILKEGYFHLPRMSWDMPVGAMADTIGRLVAQGYAAPFCFMYDEFWMIFAKVHGILRLLLGDGYRMLPDFWAWHVDPRSQQSGWKPHRDKGQRSLMPDGRPKSLTVWIPLTDAMPLNSCIYIVPADRDPTYNSPQEDQWSFAYQDIRALPSPAGGLFCWNQAVLHWGSSGSPRADGPRISIAFEFQRGDVSPFNTPLLEPLGAVPLETRLALVCKQLLQYRHMYNLPGDLQAFAEETLARLRRAT